MDQAKLLQAEELFHGVADLPRDQRRLELDERCRGDAELRALVLQLLANDDGAMGEFLATPILDAAQAVEGPLDSIPTRVGRYTIVRAIGEGGMGTVFEATQDTPRRTVALKVIRPGVASHRVLRRFQHEAEILGQLQHPGIAGIYDAGMADAEYAGGATARQPYFAMELIRGRPLTAFVNENRLHDRDRLELLAKVCDAVHHAHQKGVIHRDLKPANILVTQEGVPKVLDFGIARLMDSDLGSITLTAGPGQLIGTIQYMSPEQASGNRSELDIRSDVYSLGVILHELLAGRLPHDLKDRSIPEAVRILRDEEPTRLSAVRSILRGDLETITAKALEKDKSRRYPSASELAADLRRYLSDEPISARPPSTLYQLGKFARRNRGMVAAGAAAIVILVAGIIVSSALAVGHYRALRESERQRRIAEAVNAFLNDDLLAQANPESQPDRGVTLREIVDRASESIGNRFGDEPLVEASIRATLSNTYRGLGEYADAGKHAQRILEIFEQAGPAHERERLRAIDRLASLEQELGLADQAEKRLREALGAARGRLGEEDEVTLLLMNSLAMSLTDRQELQEAADLLAQVIERRTRLAGEEHRDTMNAINNLARVYVYMNRFDEAERLHLKEIELCRRALGPDHPDTLLSLSNLGVLYNNRRDFQKAEPLVREVLEVRTRVLGPEHPRTLESLDGLGAILIGVRRFEDAEPVVKEALARCERALGPDDPRTLQARERLISMYILSSRWDEAEPHVLTNLEARRRVQGEDHFKVGVNWCFLCRVDEGKNRLEEALGHCRRAYAILEPVWGAEDPFNQKTKLLLCDIAKRLGRPEEVGTWCEPPTEERMPGTPQGSPD